MSETVNLFIKYSNSMIRHTTVRERERRTETSREGGEKPGAVQSKPPQFNPPPHLPVTLMPYFSRNVVAVDGLLLKKHVKTALVLGQGVTCNSAETDGRIIKHNNLPGFGAFQRIG